MSRILRVVFDTSTLVSAALRVGSTPHRALMHAYRTCDLCATAATLAELEEVLSRAKFDRYVNREERHAFLTALRRNSHLFEMQDANLAAVQPPCRDPSDNKFLALALAAEADAIVASDNDLLVLDPWRNIPALAPADFLAWLEHSSGTGKGR